MKEKIVNELNHKKSARLDCGNLITKEEDEILTKAYFFIKI